MAKWRRAGAPLVSFECPKHGRVEIWAEKARQVVHNGHNTALLPGKAYVPYAVFTAGGRRPVVPANGTTGIAAEAERWLSSIARHPSSDGRSPKGAPPAL